MSPVMRPTLGMFTHVGVITDMAFRGLFGTATAGTRLERGQTAASVLLGLMRGPR
jgi:hypothetical protein